MASSILRMASPLSTQFAIKKSPTSELTPKEIRPFQIRWKVDSDHETPKTLSVSRRDAMLSLIALSVTAIGMSSPETAEARMSKAEMKRKIREKLQQLREKASLSKKEESDKAKPLSPHPPSTKKDNKLPLDLEPAPFPLPNPPQNSNKSTVEVTFS
ncbi:hypothetical protein Cgig2_031711 [Carnegiea gigantea]|uniref:Uncharacterized protein n=1 Tax=Carnegiea gigantea TaxID=171969 RepID=A0A9Q1QMF1_9CARY|nr:hypothetical protein Cgig2_031711 [Carnegiea gigantea]